MGSPLRSGVHRTDRRFHRSGLLARFSPPDSPTLPLPRQLRTRRRKRFTFMGFCPDATWRFHRRTQLPATQMLYALAVRSSVEPVAASRAAEALLRGSRRPSGRHSHQAWLSQPEIKRPRATAEIGVPRQQDGSRRLNCPAPFDRAGLPAFPDTCRRHQRLRYSDTARGRRSVLWRAAPIEVILYE